MNELETTLRNLDWENPQNSFTSIAQTLMGKYVVKKGNNRYAIIEIEFYLYSNAHQDYIVYPRNIEVGRWFFHQSGVDLTFESNNIHITKNKEGKKIVTLGSNPQFGGILIRGLYKLNPTKDEEPYLFGPQKCVNELWDKFNALTPSTDEYPIIVNTIPEDNLNISNLIRCKRCINIKNDIEVRTKKIKEWAKRLGIEISNDKYQQEMFDNQETQLYRYFNLPNGENPCTLINIPASSRPKKILAVI